MEEGASFVYGLRSLEVDSDLSSSRMGTAPILYTMTASSLHSVGLETSQSRSEGLETSTHSSILNGLQIFVLIDASRRAMPVAVLI